MLKSKVTIFFDVRPINKLHTFVFDFNPKNQELTLHKFEQATVDRLKLLLATPQNIVITTHYNPDGDALGSSLALYRFLKSSGQNVSVLIPNEYPGFLNWMPDLKSALVYSKDQQNAELLLNSASIIFCLDYNGFNRVNLFVDKLVAANGIKILLDHHLQPENTFDLAFSVIETSSTSELVYDLIDALGKIELIDKESATCLYVGIMTDTGSFSFACNLPRTYEVVADLVRKGVDTEQVHRLVYDTWSENRMKLLGYCLSEKLTVLKEYATAFIWLTAGDMHKYNVQSGDTEGIVNYALSIKGISFAAFFTEKPDRIRISFRSKGSFSVNAFARDNFNGGGHRNAAGGDSFQSMENTLQRFKDTLPAYKTDIVAAADESSRFQL